MMKQILISFSLFAIALSGTTYADYCCEPEDDCSFYLKLGTGISFSEAAKISAPVSTWYPAVQGYNSRLGNRAIAEFGIGCELMNFLDLEVSVSARTSFKYRKFQTPLDGGSSYKRKFDLTVIPVLFSFNLLGKDISCLNWECGCGKIYPTLGAGIGVSNLLITNFRTTGLAPTGASSPYESFSGENQHTLRQNFTYTVSLGLEYNHCDCWAISTGYRWFDAGSFKGPRYLRVNSGGAVDVGSKAWKMHFKSNEWLVEFKIFL